MNLYPSILTDSIQTVQEQLDLIAPFSNRMQVVQIDIVDGEYADNLTVTPIDLLDINFHDFHIDFHLMVNEPDDYVYECAQLDNVRSVIAQIERLGDQSGCIDALKKKEIHAGFSLDLYTPFDSIEKVVLNELAIIQVMGIQAGFQNQTFEGEKVLRKIEAVKQAIQPHDQIELIVDGGVKIGNFKSILHAGADGISVGSELWQSGDIEKTINEFFQV